MIAKTLLFGSPGKLSLKYDQLVYTGEDGTERSFPIEDIGFVIVENKLITLTTALLQKLSAFNVSFVICDETHTPSAQLHAYAANTTAEEITAAQFSTTAAVNGRLWRQIVRAKILNQAALMDRLKAVGGDRLRSLADATKNYDETNCEAQAARFRKDLLKDGFAMHQYSVYIRHCASNEALEVHTKRVKFMVPDEGIVSILRVTDKQYGDTIQFVGKKRRTPPSIPVQLELF